MDAGSYSEKIIKAVSSQLFYIRANKCESLTEEIRQIIDWQTVEINFKNYEVASVPFTHFLNDFGWNHLPTSNMNSNTAYLILTAMLKNFYNYLVNKVADVFTDILPTSRLKRFIFRFITVPGRYVYRGRQWILQLYTNRPYEKVLT